MMCVTVGRKTTRIDDSRACASASSAGRSHFGLHTVPTTHRGGATARPSGQVGAPFGPRQDQKMVTGCKPYGSKESATTACSREPLLANGKLFVTQLRSKNEDGKRCSPSFKRR